MASRRAKPMRVLVTGGCGYIGSHVAHALAARGYAPLIYDNLSSGHRDFAWGLPLVEGDVRDWKKLRASLYGVEAVLHFAAHIDVGESVRDPLKYFDNNVAGSLALLRMAQEAGVRYFLFSSSAAVYGNPDKTPISEDAVTRPVNPYGLSKLFVEEALAAVGKGSGLRHISLRYFNAAGAHESGALAELHTPETHLIPSLLLTAAGLRDVASIFGSDYPTPDGTCVRDFVHVSDLADAHLRALEYLRASGESRALNVGLGEGYSVLEVIHAVEKVTGRELPKRFLPRRPGDVPVLMADSRMARSVLGWTPRRRLPEMVFTAWKALQKFDRLLFPGPQQPAQTVEPISLNEEARRERISRR